MRKVGNNSSISGNYAGTGGGGIYNLSLSGTLTVTNSTLSDNTTLNHGGGIDDAGGALTISNSILDGNQSLEGSGGGLSVQDNAGAQRITNSTITGNTSSEDGGGISNAIDVPVYLFDSIVDGNTSATGADLYGLVNPSSSYNLVGDFSDTGALTTTNKNILGLTADLDPALFVPLAGSPALHAGSTAGAPATDVYGNPRIVNGTIDIGAVESSGASSSLTVVVSPSTTELDLAASPCLR